MPRKLPPYRTKRSFVYAAIRKVWLYSKERQHALKAENHQCEECNSKDNIHVHHKDGTSLKEVVDLIYERLLVHPDRLEVLCEDCHKEAHKNNT